MRKLLVTFPVITIILFSCQKEVDFLNGNGGGGGGGTTGTRLVKTVSKTVSDSVITMYTYNSSGKLINVTSTGMDAGMDAGNEFRYYRNASGIITRKVQVNSNLVTAGIDSVVTIVHYNASTSKYTSSVFELSLFGLTVNDSSVNVYNAAGRLIRIDEYQAILNLGQPYELTIKAMYTYEAGGNIKQVDIYSHDAATGADDLVSTLKYTFDTKTASINYGADAIGVGQPDLASNNNIVKAEIIDAGDPSNNQTLDFTYTYNNANRPVTGTNTLTPGSVVKNLSFYYQ